jgi:hypothetical protein
MPPRRGLCLLAIVLVSIFVASCDDDPTYGDDAESFVDHDAYPLSVALTKSDLKNRWLNAFTFAALEFATRMEVARQRVVQSMTVRTITKDDATDVLWKDLEATDAALAEMTEIRKELDHIVELHSNIMSVCDSKDTYYRAGLDKLGFLGPLDGLVGAKSNYSVSVTYTSGGDNSGQSNLWDNLVSLGKSIRDLILGSEADKQNDTLKRAIARYPSVVVHGDELFGISKNACSKEFEVLRPSFDKIASNYNELSLLWATEHQLLITRQRTLERLLIPRAIQENERASGLLATAQASDRAITRGRILIDIELLRNQLASLEKHANSACTNLNGRLQIEEYEDALLEAKSQLEVLDRALDYQGGRVHMTLEQVRAALAELPAMYTRGGTPCH